MKKLLFLLTIIIIFSCKTKSDYYPEQFDEVNDYRYKKYSTKLKKAYKDKDYFEAGLQLANLKASSEIVFNYINSGIKEDYRNCYKIYNWNSIYSEFKNNLVKLDTIKFKNSVKICLQLLGKDSFIEYISQKKITYQKKILKRKKLDSTKFNLELINQLQIIIDDDQKFRGKRNNTRLTKEEKREIGIKIHKIDSINLIKIIEIIDEYGDIKVENVGYDLVTVPWLVFQHQSDIKIRDKFQNFIEKNYKGGLLDTYNWRSKDIRNR